MSITFAAAATDENGCIRMDLATEDEEMNVSTANGYALLVALGFGPTPEYCGEAEASDIIGRCLLAQALPEGDMLEVTDPATQALLEAFGAGSEGGPTLIANPRREGYMAEKIGRLLEIAQAAAASGKLVSWA